MSDSLLPRAEPQATAVPGSNTGSTGLTPGQALASGTVVPTPATAPPLLVPPAGGVVLPPSPFSSPAFAPPESVPASAPPIANPTFPVGSPPPAVPAQPAAPPAPTSPPAQPAEPLPEMDLV